MSKWGILNAARQTFVLFHAYDPLPVLSLMLSIIVMPSKQLTFKNLGEKKKKKIQYTITL